MVVTLEMTAYVSWERLSDDWFIGLAGGGIDDDLVVAEELREEALEAFPYQILASDASDDELRDQLIHAQGEYELPFTL